MSEVRHDWSSDDVCPPTARPPGVNSHLSRYLARESKHDMRPSSAAQYGHARVITSAGWRRRGMKHASAFLRFGFGGRVAGPMARRR